MGKWSVPGHAAGNERPLYNKSFPNAEWQFAARMSRSNSAVEHEHRRPW